MSYLFENNASTTLASAIGTGDLSLTVATGDGAEFPSPTGSDFFQCILLDTAGNWEFIKVTSRSTDTFTIVRAQESTTAKTFAAGSLVELRPTAGFLGTLANKVDIQDGSPNYAVGGGTANAQTVALTPTLTAYADGMLLRWLPIANNTGACVVNVDSVGDIAVKKLDSSGAVVNVAADDVDASSPAMAIYRAAATPFFLLITHRHGTAGILDAGTSASQVVQLDASAKLPAVDASQLVNRPGDGRCQFVYTSTTVGTLLPFNGNNLDLWDGTNWVPYTIPDSGITIDATGSVWDSGAGLTTISTATEYDIYCDYNSGSPRLVGYKHSVAGHSISNGRHTLTGGKAWRLVGKVQTNWALGQFVDSSTQRFLISWFNRRELYLSVSTTSDSTSSLTSVELNSAHRLEFVSWGKGQQGWCNGTLANNTAGQASYVTFMVDGVLTTALSGGHSYGALYQVPGSIVWVGDLAEGYHYFSTGGVVTGGTMTIPSGEIRAVIQG